MFYPGAKTAKLRELVYTGTLDSKLRDAGGIIILVGTNNLKLDTPHDIAFNLLTYAQLFKTKFRHLEVCISTLLPRVDKRPLNAKVPVVNEILKKNAPKFQIQIFDLAKSFLKAGRPKEHFIWHTDGLHLSHIGIKKLKHSLNNQIYLLRQRKGLVI